ncbi:importin subunit alpha-2 [Trifolium repens]|nr:importin subunit alpha-2 [Trifolium repens]
MVRLSADKHSPVQCLALGCLNNIAAGRSEHTQLLVKKKAIPVLIKLLSSRSNILKSLAIRGLGNIAAGDGACRRAIFCSSGIIELTTVFNNRDDHFKDVNGTLLNLFRKKVPSSVPNLCIKAWISYFLKSIIVRCKHLDLTYKALEIVNHVPGNIKKVLVDNKVLTHLKLIIEAEHLSLPLLREVCEAILCLPLMNLITHRPDPAIKLAAAKIIFNVTCVGLEHTMLLPLGLCIEDLCTLFLDNDDVELLELSLGAIHNFLLDGQTDHNIETIAKLIDDEDGAVDKLNSLMRKDGSKISRLAEIILDKLKLE